MSEVLSQADIDALLQGGSPSGSISEATQYPSAESSRSLSTGEETSLLSQDEIEALLSGVSQANSRDSQESLHTDAQSSLLSQDEIDALLQGLSEERAVSRGFDGAEEIARPYDFSSPDLSIRGFVFTLEMVNERFARYFRISLFNLLRYYSEINLYGIQVVKFGAYAHGLPSPISVNLFRVKPLGGMALLVFSADLVTAVVDIFFGGGRFRSQQKKRDFTLAETRVIRMMVDRAVKDLKESWGSVMPLDFEYLSSEINPHYASVITAGDMVVVAIFRIAFEGTLGELHVVFPYSMLEPLRERLTAPIQSKGLETSQRFITAMRDGMQEAEVEVSCVLAEADITVGDLIRLKPGDVIPVELPKRVALQAAEVPIFWGRYGVSQGNWAVKVMEPVIHG